MLNPVLFLDPIGPYFEPITAADIEKTTRWLKEIVDAFNQGAGDIRPQSEGVDDARFGWGDVRRVLLASSCECSDRPQYFIEAYASLRDGRLVRLHGEYGITRDDIRKEAVYVEAWKQGDWDAFYDHLMASLPDPDDVDMHAHISACGSVLEFLY